VELRCVSFGVPMLWLCSKLVGKHGGWGDDSAAEGSRYLTGRFRNCR
jgi:hypothetical protein